MPSFAASLGGAGGGEGAGAESDAVAAELSGDDPKATIDGSTDGRLASRRPLPQWLQKFAWTRLIAWQRGHCLGNLTPQTSQKRALGGLRCAHGDTKPSGAPLSSSCMTVLLD
jgi:hypothetical protein